MEFELKTRKMKEDKVNEVIVTFADYVENYCDRESTADDVPSIVHAHFDEFIEWAFDDFVINEAEQDALKGKPDTRLRKSIILEVIQEFLMILRLRQYKASVGNTPV